VIPEPATLRKRVGGSGAKAKNRDVQKKEKAGGSNRSKLAKTADAVRIGEDWADCRAGRGGTPFSQAL
jgi:hypothetical protein